VAPKTIGIPNFEWNVTPLGPTDSPHRYRALYDFAATNLNLATMLWFVTNYLCDPTNVETQDLAKQSIGSGILEPISKPNRDGIAALRESMHAARALFLISHEAVSQPSVLARRSDRFPRYFITRRVETRLFRADYDDFLRYDVEPGAMAVIAGALQLRDQAFASLGPPWMPLDAQRNTPPDDADKLIEDGRPASVADQLAKDDEPSRQAIVAWLDDQEGLSYRLRFNLACYHSRESASQAKGESDSELDLALSNLGRCFATCPHEDLESTTHQAWIDPALAALRLERADEFRAMVNVDQPADADPEAATSQSEINAEGVIPAPLVAATDERERLNRHLKRMRGEPPKLLRTELVGGAAPTNLVNQAISALPERTQETDRELLRRLLFLPSWPAEVGSGVADGDGA
jgi:hypothetical protein